MSSGPWAGLTNLLKRSLPEVGCDWVVVGVIAAPHGVRGEVRVSPQTDFPERLSHLGEVTLVLPNGTTRAATIMGGRWHTAKHAALLTFADCRTRTEAEGLRNAQIVVRPADSPSLPEGQYYDWQLIGLRVVTTDGREIGRVQEVVHTGANDVYVTEKHLLPAIEDVIKQIDLAGGRLVIEPVPGLLE